MAIAPIKTGAAGPVETDPLLSKDIRFLFAPNSSDLDVTNQENLRNLKAIKRLLTVSPGSTILLRGHVDNSLVEQFRKQGGEPFVRQMALMAVVIKSTQTQTGAQSRLCQAAEASKLEELEQRLEFDEASTDGFEIIIWSRPW